MQYASQNLIPVTLELGGKSPNVFFEDVAAKDDDFYDKALEGFTLFALNQGEVCTCPSRALVQSSIYDKFLDDATARTQLIKQGNPLDTDTMIGAQASNDQLEKILSYIDIGQKEGARLAHRRPPLRPRRRPDRRLLRRADDLRGRQLDADLPGGDLRPGRRRSRGSTTTTTRSRSRTTPSTGSAPACGRATCNTAYRVGRGIQAGRVWTNCYHAYPAHAAFGGYKQLGHRPREPPDDARPLPADQEPAGVLQPAEARLLLGRSGSTPIRADVADPRRRDPGGGGSAPQPPGAHGPLMFHQSGGCCDGSSPMCYPAGEFQTGPADVLLGELDVDGASTGGHVPVAG